MQDILKKSMAWAYHARVRSLHHSIHHMHQHCCALQLMSKGQVKNIVCTSLFPMRESRQGSVLDLQCTREYPAKRVGWKRMVALPLLEGSSNTSW